MGEIVPGTFVKEMLQAVPELAESYGLAELKWNADPSRESYHRLLHMVAWEHLTPHIHRLLLDESQNHARLAGIFAFLERASKSSDMEVVNVVDVTIMEALCGLRSLNNSIDSLLKENKLEAAADRIMNFEKDAPGSREAEEWLFPLTWKYLGKGLLESWFRIQETQNVPLWWNASLKKLYTEKNV